MYIIKKLVENETVNIKKTNKTGVNAFWVAAYHG